MKLDGFELSGFHPELRNYPSTRQLQLCLRKSLPPDGLALGLSDAAKLVEKMIRPSPKSSVPEPSRCIAR